MSVNATLETFDAEVAGSDRPVLVDFWAPWCVYCRALAPVIERIADDHDVHLVKVNTDEAPEIAQRFDVRGIPQLLLFRDGKLTGTYLGTGPRQDVERGLGLDAHGVTPARHRAPAASASSDVRDPDALHDVT